MWITGFAKFKIGKHVSFYGYAAGFTGHTNKPPSE
jgi:hypothetical protein